MDETLDGFPETHLMRLQDIRNRPIILSMLKLTVLCNIVSTFVSGVMTDVCKPNFCLGDDGLGIRFDTDSKVL